MHVTRRYVILYAQLAALHLRSSMHCKIILVSENFILEVYSTQMLVYRCLEMVFTPKEIVII